MLGRIIVVVINKEAALHLRYKNVVYFQQWKNIYEEYVFLYT